MTPGYLDPPVVFGSLAEAYDNVGVSDDDAPGQADFDGSGYSYSAQALAAVGLTPGANVPAGSTRFTWPTAAPASPDNVVAAGQLIAVNRSGSTLSFLGAANNGSGSGTGTITYTDGSTSSFTLALTNWTPSSPLASDTLVATAHTWNRPAGSPYPAAMDVSVYATSIGLDKDKTVSYVTLPVSVSGDQTGTRLHVFEMVVS